MTSIRRNTNERKIDMRTESFESSISSRTSEVKGVPMQQAFFLVVTATAGLLVALALALATFPGAATAALTCPREDPTCDPTLVPPPTVTADQAEITVMAGDTARNSGTYGIVCNDCATDIKISASRDGNPYGIVTQNGSPDSGTWNWEIVTECVPTYQEYPVTITARDTKSGKQSSTTFKVIVNGRQECGPQPQPVTTIKNYTAGKSEDWARFEFESNHAAYTAFECKDLRKVDNEWPIEHDWALCSSPKLYDNLVDGEHRFQVRAINPTTDEKTDPAEHTWTVDKPPPVILVPALMGSKLSCGENELWPDIPSPELGSLRLQVDGVTDFTCVPQVSGLLEEIAIDTGLFDVVVKDFYKSGLASLSMGTATKSRVYVYPYDWRKSPEYATEGLDQMVDRALSETGNDQVAILAHSMGGLVTRRYIDDPSRAQKVERVVTLGTPYWGAPKAWGMLAHGQTSPTFSALDLIIDNDEGRLFARNSSGLYSMFPSDSYLSATRGWLTYTNRNGGNPLDVQGTLNAIATLDDPGGNWQLAQNARSLHGNYLDSFATKIDANGRVNGVDYRVLVGTGFLTPTRVTENPEPWLDETTWAFGNGDATVPLVSAMADAEGRVPISYTCGVVHDELAQAKVVDKLVEFLLWGSTHSVDNMMCGANGNGTIIHGDMDGAQVFEKVEEKTRTMPLKQAEAEGLVEVIEGEGQTLIVTNDHEPVSISVSGEDVAIEVTRVENSQQLDPVAFKPTDGEVTIRPGEQTSVTLGGPDQALPPPPVGEVPLDKTAPVTTVNARRSGESFFLTANAQDDSGVQATYYRIGEEEPRKWEGEIEVPASQLGSVRFGSVDVYGNNEAERNLTVDSASPKVSSVTPANNATGVKRNANLTATFSEKMDPSTLTNATFKLFKVNTDGSTTQVTNATVTPSTDGLKATLNPFGTSTTLLAKSTKYKAIVTTEAKDVTGNPLDQNPTTSGNQQMAWSFKTGLQ